MKLNIDTHVTEPDEQRQITLARCRNILRKAKKDGLYIADEKSVLHRLIFALGLHAEVFVAPKPRAKRKKRDT